MRSEPRAFCFLGEKSVHLLQKTKLFDMQRVLFLYNGNSGRGDILRHKEQICAILSSRGAEVAAEEICFGRNPFDGHDDIDTVVVAGGDGTLNYVVNAMATSGRNLAIGIIPAGTANDFARAVGMSRRVEEAARQIVDGSEHRFDCGKVNDRYFVNILSFGLFTTTSQHTPDNLKHRFGPLAYIHEGLKELREPPRTQLHIKTENEEFDCEVLMSLVFNGLTAGGFPLTRHSDLHDGVFDCLLLRNRNMLRSCTNMVEYLMGLSPHDVIHFKASHIEITSQHNLSTDIDGQAGPSFPLVVECLHDYLRILTK